MTNPCRLSAHRRANRVRGEHDKREVSVVRDSRPILSAERASTEVTVEQIVARYWWYNWERFCAVAAAASPARDKGEGKASHEADHE